LGGGDVTVNFFVMILLMFVFGAAVGFLSNRFYKINPWGAIPARMTIYLVGTIVVGTAIFISVLLWFDWIGLPGTYGPAYMLHLELIDLHLNEKLDPNLTAFFLVLLYPVAYLVAANFVQRSVGLDFPAIREPIDLPPDKSIMVIADTHLGLQRNAVNQAMREGPRCEPTVVANFFQWMNDQSGASPNKTMVPSWERVGGNPGKVVQHPIHPPRYAVLLGDILEMWDGTDESVQWSMSTIFPRLSRSEAETVYIVGNHDHAMERDQTSSSAGMGGINVVPEVWPGPDTSYPLDPGGHGIRPIRAGDQQYMFIHGHQFGLGFQLVGPLAYVPGHLRRAARLGHYAWLFGIVALTVFAYGAISGSDNWMMVLLALLTIPIGYMTLGRFVFRIFAGGRYKTEQALRGFYLWWRARAGGGRLRRGVSLDLQDLNIVYGHTHIIDIVDKDQAKKHKLFPRKADLDGIPRLLNLPSWIDDPEVDAERAIFLYVDSLGYKFLGWDWSADRPFHIPDDLIRGRRDHLSMARALEKAGLKATDLDDLKWPVSFQEKWFHVYST
jgi:hypothetical protein